MSEGTRRERSKSEKQERIFLAARTLFAEHGFAAVTTQQIADAADVATGTVFRYAATKGELLLMVYNDELRDAVTRGLDAAAGLHGTADAVVAAVEPLLTAASRARDIAIYQRELLFGPPQERYRSEGLAIIGRLERGVARILAGDGEPGAAAMLAARSVFAVVHLALVDPMGLDIRTQPDGAHARVRAQVHQIVLGHAAEASETAGEPRRKEGSS